jgi:glycosyltransferase involved in cell wall biosynthesis
MKLILGRDCPPIVAKISNDLDRRDTPGWQRWFYRRWLRLQGRFIDHFTGMETPMLAEIAEATGVSADRITVIPDPALSEELIDRLRALPEPERTRPGRRFVAIGRLAAQKNIALMLDAFAQGSGPDDRLALIGDGPDRAALEARAKRLGIAVRVEFLGYRPDPAQLLPAHDVLLLSSDFEGVPAVVLEALAARRAIIATRCSRSMSALLRDGALGTLVPVGDVRALADAIAAARPGDQDDAASLAQARRFTIEAAADRYWATFAQVARTTEGAVA